MPRVVIVGGGPAGLAAAVTAAMAGAETLLLEERAEPGGQLRYRAQPVEFAPGETVERPDHLADRLAAAAVQAGTDIRTGEVVAGCFGERELLVVGDGGSRRLATDALVIATGSTDLPFPFAGATFPGVMTARALQILLNQHRVRPGRQFAIIGGGEAAEELADDIHLAGGVVAWSGVAPAPFLRAEGRDGVRALIVGQERVTVDIVVIAVGRQADAALATMAGVPLGFAPELGGLVPIVDERLQSQAGGVFVAGDAAGPGSVAAAIAEGGIAGTAAARLLGFGDALRGVEEPTAMRSIAEVARRMSLRHGLTPVHSQPWEQESP